MNDANLTNIHLEPESNSRLASLCGLYNEHLQQMEKHLGVNINHRGHHFQISGEKKDVIVAQQLLHKLYAETAKNNTLSPSNIHLMLQGSKDFIMQQYSAPGSPKNKNVIAIHTKSGTITPYTENQKLYIQNILNYDINFCVGPAGTGKTYLAVACAVDALKKGMAQRILLVRPVLEAGEKLGFLPGDLTQKIEPYLRPLYDALFEMLGFEQVSKYLEQNIIEIAPLAYMRGRTLNESMIILDESQNTTVEQMKMFLTRIGFGSTAIITGDITQTDLPKGKKSGLIDAMDILQNVEGICFTHFDSKDVVRHNIVQRIIEAYELYEAEQKRSE